MDRSPLPGYYQSLPLAFATHAGAYAIGGYDTFLEGSLAARRVRYKFWSDPIAAARAYGVKWAVSARTLDDPVASPNPFFSSLDAPSAGNVMAIHAVEDAGRLAGSENGLSLFELAGADPFAFLTPGPNPVRPSAAIPILMNTSGAVADTSSARPGDTLICNIAMRPFMKATDNRGQPLPAEADEWGRVRIHLRQPASTVVVSYRPPWTATLLCGALLLVMGLLAGCWTRRLASGNP